MKIIDLLNKIANGEEMPKKIKYDNLVYEYNEQYDYKNELQINYYSFDNGTDFFNNVFCYSLNDEIEILEEEPRDIEVCGTWITKSEYDKLANGEEEKKIPEKLNLDIDKLRGKETPRAIDYLIESKINQVIDYLKSKGE